MSKFETFMCDQCEVESSSPLVYRIAQIVDDPDSEDEDDPEHVVNTYDLCSTACLHNFVTDLAFDFPDVEAPVDTE